MVWLGGSQDDMVRVVCACAGVHIRVAASRDAARVAIFFICFLLGCSGLWFDCHVVVVLQAADCVLHETSVKRMVSVVHVGI
jgi:hypothetical protein